MYRQTHRANKYDTQCDGNTLRGDKRFTASKKDT